MLGLLQPKFCHPVALVLEGLCPSLAGVCNPEKAGSRVWLVASDLIYLCWTSPYIWYEPSHPVPLLSRLSARLLVLCQQEPGAVLGSVTSCFLWEAVGCFKEP